jgi:hypothetical protein
VRALLRSVAVVAVFAMAACGEESVGSPPAPVSAGDVIVVSRDSQLARQLDGPAVMDLTLGPGVAVPATTGTLAWTSVAGDPGSEIVAALATALGAEGELEQDAAGAWSVGTSPDSPVGLLAGGYLGDAFTFTSAARWEQFAANPCDPATVTCPGPTGVPDQAIASQAADRVIDALGIDRDRVDVATEVREDGMLVTVRGRVDGVAPLEEPDVELLVGSDGSILQAHGRTSVADESRLVDLVDAETAIVRAERWLSGGPAITRPPIAELPATTSSVVPMVPAATSPIPATPAGAPGAVGEGAPGGGEPSATDTVIGFGVGHAVVWDVEGRRWVVPTFAISTSRGLLVTVFAIADEQVRVVDAPTGDRDGGPAAPALAPPIAPPPSPPPPASFVPAPTVPLEQPATTAVTPCSGAPLSDQPGPTVLPARTGPADGETREEWGASAVEAISPSVVGLPTTEAAMLLERACWRVMISYPGAPTTTITPDLPWDRLVLVDDGNGRVAAVVFI